MTVSRRIAALEAYVPGEQPTDTTLVKLNTNENPYPPSPRAIDAIQRAAEAGLERYPDPESTVLREAIAARHGLESSQVFAGNGSDEVLAHAFFAFFQQDAPLLVPDLGVRHRLANPGRGLRLRVGAKVDHGLHAR